MPLAGMPQEAELYGEAQPIDGAALGPDEHQVFGAEHVMPSHLGRRGWDGKQAGALLGGQQGAAGHAGPRLAKRPFITCLPFSTILQQGIESRNPRFYRGHQTHAQTSERL